MEPAVEAVAVEDVAAGKHPYLFPFLEVGLADDAGVGVGVVDDGVGVEESVVNGQLIGEHDESGEAGSDGGEESVVDDLVCVEPRET